jgi:hypothetical protein
VHITESTDDAPDRAMNALLAAVCNNPQWLRKFRESDAWTLSAQNKYFGKRYKNAGTEIRSSNVYLMADYLNI